ncbi:MAG: hypothetical protein J7484_02275 [Microbacterium sp.]|nr:hypothetical protein [Microbacterium sp.]
MNAGESAREENPETAVPTPSPSSGTDAGDFTVGGEPDTARTPEQADSPEDADNDEIPSDDELEEPSTEKEPSEEPKAPNRDDPEPDHRAVGIGVIDS